MDCVGTGTDTDRLKEEKKRGITIEIGFAKLTLPNGQTASIIDVPGHERLIRNMLVGAGGIDVVLLVIAADEGVMPQTQEHLEILSLLGIKQGIIVLTKMDMVDKEWLEMVTEDIREHMSGTFLENAPILPVSSSTGEGIEELKTAIVSLLEDLPPRSSDRPVRLPVDRAFPVKGFGTVVTGTLMDGTLNAGDTVMVYPQQKLAKVRELQNHDVSQAQVEAGMRVAINLSGVDRQELIRGCTIAQPDSMQLTRRIAVRLELTPDTPFEVRNASQLHFYQGTQELLCKVRLLDTNLLQKGCSSYAELTFEEDLAARNLDRFIVRFFSPMTTVGGGVILDMETPRLKRNDVRVLNRLRQLDCSPKTRIRQMIYDAGYRLPKEQDLNRLSGLSARSVREALEELERGREVIRIGTGLISVDVLNTVWLNMESLLRSYHTRQPLQEGMPLGELREKVFSDAPKSADAIVELPPFRLDSAIPRKYAETFSASPQELLSGLQYLNAAAPKTRTPYVCLNGSELSMTVNGRKYSVVTDIQRTGGMAMHLNLHYMIDALKQFSKEKCVTVKISGIHTPVVIEAEGRNDHAMVLPIRSSVSAAA